MADTERIGLEAVLNDQDFQAGLKRYLDGVSRLEGNTAKAAKGMTLAWDSAAGRWRNALGQFATSAELAEAGVTKSHHGITASLGDMLSKVGNGLSSFGKQYVTLGNTVWNVAGRVAQAAAVGFGALVAGMGTVTAASLKFASDYEKSMLLIAGLTDTPASEIGKISEEVLSMAQEFGLPAQQMADAMYFIASSGFAGAKGLEVLRAAAMGSAAGLGSSKTLADALTSAMNAYGASNLDAAQAMDILTAAVREGKGEPDALAGALGRVLPIAAAAGVSMEEIGASLAVMTRTGLSADEAATALRGTIGALIAPSKESKDALAKFGLTADDLRKSIKDKGLTATLAELVKLAGTPITTSILPKEQADELLRYQKALKSVEQRIRDYESGVKGAGQTEKQRGAAMSKLYTEAGILREQIAALSGAEKVSVTTGGDMIETLDQIIPNVRALTGVLSSSVSQGDEYARVLEEMRGATGTTSRAFEVAAKGWSFQFERFKTTGINALIKMGQQLLPTLTPLLSGITDALSKIDLSGLANVIGGALQGIAGTVGNLFSAFQTGGMGGLIAALGLSPEAQALLQTIGADLAAFGTFVTGTLVPALVELGERAMPIVNQALGFLNEHWDEFRAALAGVGAVLAGAAIAAAISAIGGAIAAIGAPILALVAAAGVLAAAWEGDWGGIRTTLTDVWTNTLQPALATLWEWLQVNVPAAIQTLTDFWNNVLMPALTAVWNYVTANIFPLFEALANVAIALVKKEVEALSGLWQNVLMPALTTAWEFISKYVLPAFQQVYDIIATYVFPIVQQFAEFIGNTLVAAFNGITGAIGDAVKWLNDLAAKINALQLPDWLTPGSPTPFEEGLVGVSGATQSLASDLDAALAPALDKVGGILHNDLNVWLGEDEGLTYLLRLVGQESARAQGWADNFEAAFYTIRAAVADAAAVADGLLSALEGIKSIGTITNHIWVITHHKDIIEPAEDRSGGGGNAGGGPSGRQHGGWTFAGGLTRTHPNEFVLSNAMLRGMQSIPQIVQRAVLRQALGPISGATTNVYNNQRTAQIQMSPQYQQVQSPASVYYNLSAALVAAGM